MTRQLQISRWRQPPQMQGLKDGSDSPKTDGVEVDMRDTVRNPSAFGIFYRLVCQLIKS